MTVTKQQIEELKAVYRQNTAAQLNRNLEDTNALMSRFPDTMVEYLETARRLCLEECGRRNQMRDIWETGKTGFLPRGYSEQM